MSAEKREHEPVRTKDGWWCRECLKSWKCKPKSACKGSVVFTWWDAVPEHLKTTTQLGKEGLKPGPYYRALIDTTKYRGGLYKLFDVAEATPKRKTSAAQLRALDRAREAADRQRRTCPGCERLVEDAYEFTVNQGICSRCAEARFSAMLTKDRQEAAEWARGLLADPNLVLLDLETTGLYDAEIVQLGVLSKEGEVLLERLVKPEGDYWDTLRRERGEKVPLITSGATAVHGISDADVADAPGFIELEAALLDVLEGKTVAVYNLSFDQGVLRRELMRLYERRHDLTELSSIEQRDAQSAFARTWLSAVTWEDVMEPYAAFVGEWHEYYGDYRWQPLNGAHQAIEDCRACLDLLKEMAAGLVM